MKNPSPSDTGIILAALLGVAAVAALLLGSTYPGIPGFVVARCDGVSYLVPAPRGSYIVVEFTHSVHKTPELDVVEPGQVFRVRAIAFQEYGAGVPESPESIGGGVEDTSGEYIVYQGGGLPLQGNISYDLGNVIDPDVSIAGFWVDDSVCRSLEIEPLG